MTLIGFKEQAFEKAPLSHVSAKVANTCERNLILAY